MEGGDKLGEMEKIEERKGGRFFLREVERNGCCE